MCGGDIAGARGAAGCAAEGGDAFGGDGEAGCGSGGGVFAAQVSCEAFSPILPGDYRRTSYPVAGDAEKRQSANHGLLHAVDIFFDVIVSE